MRIFFGSISRKTAILIFIASSAFTLLITFVQLYFEYQSEKKRIVSAIDYIESTQAEHIANLLWRYDQTQLEIVARGLMSLKSVKRINIYVDESQAPIISKGDEIEIDKFERWYRKFDLKSLDKLVPVGSLEIFYDFSEAEERVYYLFWSTLYVQFLRSIVIGLFIYFLINLSIIRRLSSLEKYLSNYRKDQDRAEPFLSEVFIEKDELNRVGEVINNLLAEIQDGKNILQDELDQKKQAQERLFHLSLQMGTLQANSGIFHDLNNLLMIALNQCKKLNSVAQISSEEAAKAAETQMKTLKMMADVIRVQQEVSKKANVVAEHRLLEVVQETLALEESLLQRNQIEVDLQLDPKARYIFSKSLIILVLINLIKNACEAMVAARIPHKKIRIKASENDTQWTLEVSDNGPGVLASFKDKLFVYGETTKPEGHGFGISNCKRSLQIQGGDLIFKENQGQQGATFAIVYPKTRVS